MAWAKAALMTFSEDMLIRRSQSQSLCSIPITQDASASAYQIMSYFLLDAEIATRTNLIPNKEGIIKDIYQYIREELIYYLEGKLESNLFKEVKNQLTRKIVKGIFMPIIYGKTVMSTAGDLRAQLSEYLIKDEFFLIAKLCYSFFKEKYNLMYSLIKLIRNIGWLLSSSDIPVVYSVDYFQTIQDYKVLEPINLTLYDRNTKKRHKVTLRVPSEKRDRRKTEVSTFVNFIHQHDACIAMKVIEEMKDAPIYTVHDNFITNILNVHNTPAAYSEVICNYGTPLGIINRFILQNLIYDFDRLELEIKMNYKMSIDKQIGRAHV